MHVSQIPLNTFFQKYREEDFWVHNPYIGKQSGFFKELWGEKNFYLMEIFDKGRSLGFAAAKREKQFGIARFRFVMSPYFNKSIPAEDFLAKTALFYKSLPYKNFFMRGSVPNYLDRRMSFKVALEDDKASCWETIVVDLGENEKDLLGLLPSKGRKGIRRSLKDPRFSFLQVCSENPDSIDDYLHIFKVVKKQRRFFERELYKIRLGEAYRCFYFFILYHDSYPIALKSIFRFGNIAQEWVLAMDDRDRRENLYAGYRLKYEVMCWMRNHDIRYYDLMGVAPFPKNEKEKNIRDFKEKFGTHHIQYPLYSHSSGLGSLLAVCNKIKRLA